MFRDLRSAFEMNRPSMCQSPTKTESPQLQSLNTQTSESSQVHIGRRTRPVKKITARVKNRPRGTATGVQEGAEMNRVRSVFNNFTNSERYSRFTLQTEQDGERRVEVKLSEDGVDGDTEGGAGGSPTFRPAPRGQTRKNLCYLILTTLLIFIIGYTVAYLIHGKKRVSCETKAVELMMEEHQDSTLLSHDSQLRLPWSTVTKLLESKLTSATFDKALSEYDPPSRVAGSADDAYLGDQIHKKFQELRMEPWTDVHHVRLQIPDKTKPNIITFGSKVFKPEGFLAYSGTGTAQGRLVYANYGRPEDFKVLSSNNVGVKSAVVILRCGKISFAQKIHGRACLRRSSGFLGGESSLSYSLGGVEDITVEVNNALVFTEIHNVFGVIKGFVDPDRYVMLGAQRDAWGKGYARANVGTAALMELAKAIRDMVEKEDFRPRRSIVFASWSAGEFGNIGATEWLEAHAASIDKSVLSYISLDGMVQGHGSFYASASPLMQNLIDSAMKAVRSPTGKGTVNGMVGDTYSLRPMSMDDPAYPFLASFGIPSVSFHFTSTNDHLNYEAAQQTSVSVAAAAQFAGQMALRLVYDHLINFDLTGYKKLLNINVVRINNRVSELAKSGQLKDVSTEWLYRARASLQRAADILNDNIKKSHHDDPEVCRLLNDRIMKFEHSLLSPYTSPVETPYRHLLFGKGNHTLAAISEMTTPISCTLSWLWPPGACKAAPTL
ncbi:hypothetical protein WMY93_030035 [Mugilogobius chulae]|uniref:Transferrin receptor protein 1 n=1 Tax=Mugilogobius chulae TaxID=88201 RepID=A0AAW0MR01_9GOBI